MAGRLSLTPSVEVGLRHDGGDAETRQAEGFRERGVAFRELQPDAVDGAGLHGEVGYGPPVGSRLVGTPRVGFSTSECGRDYRVG